MDVFLVPAHQSCLEKRAWKWIVTCSAYAVGVFSGVVSVCLSPGQLTQQRAWQQQCAAAEKLCSGKWWVSVAACDMWACKYCSDCKEAQHHFLLLLMFHNFQILTALCVHVGVSLHCWWLRTCTRSIVVAGHSAWDWSAVVTRATLLLIRRWLSSTAASRWTLVKSSACLARTAPASQQHWMPSSLRRDRRPDKWVPFCIPCILVIIGPCGELHYCYYTHTHFSRTTQVSRY